MKVPRSVFQGNPIEHHLSVPVDWRLMAKYNSLCLPVTDHSTPITSVTQPTQTCRALPPAYPPLDLLSRLLGPAIWPPIASARGSFIRSLPQATLMKYRLSYDFKSSLSSVSPRQAWCSRWMRGLGSPALKLQR